MAYATKNERKKYAIILGIFYFSVIIATQIIHNIHVRYSHSNSILSYMLKIIPVIIIAIYFTKIMKKWVDGKNFNVSARYIISMVLYLFLTNIIDYIAYSAFNDFPLYQFFYQCFTALFYTSIAATMTLIFLNIIMCKLPNDEKIESFFIPLLVKISVISYTIIITLVVSLIGLNLATLEINHIDKMSISNKSNINLMRDVIDDYISYLMQQANENASNVSSILRANGTITEELILNNLSLVDKYGKEPYKNIDFFLNSTQYGNLNFKVYFNSTENTIVETPDEEMTMHLSQYEKSIKNPGTYIKLETIHNNGTPYFYISIISSIIENDEIIGYLKLNTSGAHLRNIISTHIHPGTYYYILDPNTKNIIASLDGQKINESIVGLYNVQSWKTVSSELFGINQNNNNITIDVRNNSSINDNKNYFLFANYIDEINVIFFQIIPSKIFFAADDVSEQYLKQILVIFLTILASITAFTFFIKHTIKPIELAVLYTKKLKEGEGYITERFLSITNDETGRLLINNNEFFSSLTNVLTVLKKEGVSLDSDFSTLSNILNSNTTTLNDQMTSINETVNSISNILNSISRINDSTAQQQYAFSSANVAIDELLKLISTINQNMEKQSTAVEQTSASIEQMISNISSVARSVNNADNYSSKLLEEAKTGGEIVDEVIDAIKEIEDNSDQIKDIITVIQGIAEQTNLLAMNAAIEAAHAGEQGKGFAIVADEIRSLAEHTADNTKSITAIIKEITKRVANTVSLAVGSGNSLESILSVSEKTARVVSEINIANTELEIGGKEILESVKNLNTITQMVKTGVEEQIQNGGIVENQISILNTITEEVSNAINESIEGSNEINSGLTFLTELSEKTNESNQGLNDAISSLNNSFTQFNTFVNSFNIQADDKKEATDIKESQKLIEKRKKSRQTLNEIIEDVVNTEDIKDNEQNGNDSDSLNIDLYEIDENPNDTRLA